MFFESSWWFLGCTATGDKSIPASICFLRKTKVLAKRTIFPYSYISLWLFGASLLPAGASVRRPLVDCVCGLFSCAFSVWVHSLTSLSARTFGLRRYYSWDRARNSQSTAPVCVLRLVLSLDCASVGAAFTVYVVNPTFAIETRISPLAKHCQRFYLNWAECCVLSAFITNNVR